MKKLTIIVLIFIFGYTTTAQVGIGNTDPQAQLDITAGTIPSEKDGLLIPRLDEYPAGVTTAQQGMLVFITGAGSPSQGFYYWDQGTTTWISIQGTATTDADWFVESTTNTPTAITDNIYTQGEVAINQGKLIIDPIDDATGGIDLNKNITTNTAFTLRNVDINTNITGSTGVRQFESGFSGNGTGGRTGFSNVFNGSGAASTTGFNNAFQNDAAISMIGVTNSFNNTSNNTKIGFQNILLSNAQNGSVYGTRSLILGGTGTIYGTRTEITNGSGFQYGSSIVLTNGTGTRYGYQASITGTGGGLDFGVYSDVEDVTNGYAGYFVGRMNLGNSGSNRYTMPAADGTSGQIITTDGAGTLTFQTPTASVEKIDDLIDGKSDNDGSQNGSSIYLGTGAGDSDDLSDNKNVGVGFQALENNVDGQNNTAIGYGSLNSNETGSQNTAVGLSSLFNNNGGSNNTALGYQSLLANQGGFDNTAVGMGALSNNVASAYNTSVGVQSLTSNTGASNSAFGYRALYSNGTGTRNVALGLESLNSNVVGSDNVAIGYRSGRTSTGSGNVFLGSEAGNGATGNNKLFVDNTGADEDNTLIYGEFGADDTTTGNLLRTNGELQIGNPTGTGYALPTNQGNANDILTSNGDGTTAWAAGGSTSVANGLTDNAGTIVLGGNLTQNTTITQGNFNFQKNLTGTGDFNIQDNGTTQFQVDDSGNTNIGGTLSIRNGNSTAISKINLFTDTNDGVIDIKNASNSVTVKFDATGDSYVNTGEFGVGTSLPSEILDVQGVDATGYIANFRNNSVPGVDSDGISIRLRNSFPNTSNSYVSFYRNGTSLTGRIEGSAAGTGVNYQTTSDKRLKTNFSKETDALNKILKLNPTWYEYKSNLGVKEFGFLAQEVQEVFPQIVSGDPSGDLEKQPMTVAYGRLTPLLAAGIKELLEKVETLESKNEQLKQKLKKLEQLEERLKVLEQKN